MKNNTIFYRVLQLDKNIYGELVTDQSSLQKSIAIWLSGSIISTLAVTTFFKNLVEYLKEVVSQSSSQLPQEAMLDFQTLIIEVEEGFESINNVNSLITTQLFGFINVVVSVLIIFAVLKYFFRRDPNLVFLGIIYGFSSIPILLNAPILFFDSLALQGIVLVATSIFSLVCLGSGLKQVYMLRNIEVILLILFFWFFKFGCNVDAAIILAAGESLRMGFPKQLAEYKGSTILETTIETVSTFFEETVVVLGYENETITEKVDFKSAAILINENWEEGIISSIRTGLHHINHNKNYENVFIFLGDQPSVDRKVIEKLLETKHDFDEVMIPKYRYKFGYPVVVPKYFWNKLELITQDNTSDEIDSVFGEFDLINFFESSEFKTKSVNFNFLRPTDFDEQKDF